MVFVTPPSPWSRPSLRCGRRGLPCRILLTRNDRRRIPLLPVPMSRQCLLRSSPEALAARSTSAPLRRPVTPHALPSAVELTDARVRAAGSPGADEFQRDASTTFATVEQGTSGVPAQGPYGGFHQGLGGPIQRPVHSGSLRTRRRGCSMTGRSPHRMIGVGGVGRAGSQN